MERRHVRIVRTTRLLLALQALLLTGMVSYAAAEVRQSGFDMELLGGTASTRGGFNRDAGGGLRLSTDISNGAIYGFRMGGTFYRYCGLEATFAEAATPYNAHLIDQSGNSVAGHENTSVLLMGLNGILQLPVRPVAPFVTVGLGWAVFMEPNALLTVNYGVGARVFILKHIALRSDLREYVTTGDYVIDAASINPDFHFVPVYSFHEKLRFTEFSGGLALSF